MGVYFEPRQRGFWDYVAPVVGNILGGMAGQGFEKNREIRAAKRQDELIQAEQQRKQQNRAEALAYLNDPKQSYDFRGNPEGTAQTMIEASLFDIPPDMLKQVMGTFGVPMQFQGLDRGDKITAGPFDPMTGDWGAQDYAAGTNPTKQYEQDAATKRTQIEQAGATERNNASIGAAREKFNNDKTKGELIQLSDGNYGFFNPYTGEIMPTEYAPPAQGLDLATLSKILGANGEAGAFGGQEFITPEMMPYIQQAFQNLLGIPPQEAGEPTPTAPIKGYNAQVKAMMEKAGMSREEAMNYLLSRGIKSPGYKGFSAH